MTMFYLPSSVGGVGRESLAMRVTTYADTFWGGDLSSTAGFDALKARNHDGKKICGELADYLKERSKLELDYCKKLSNLGKCFRERNELGVLEASIACLRSELNVVAGAHRKAAHFFSEQAETVEKFKKDQSLHKKGIEDALSKSQSNKISQLLKTKQLEKTYVRRCLDRDNLEQQLIVLNTSEGVQQKEIDKMLKREESAREEADKADSSYKSAVAVLETCRDSWEKNMAAACNEIQLLDEERIKFLRLELWKAVNAESQIALDVDQSCEGLREILEKCDIISDIDAFIRAHGTGSEHPEAFPCRHYTEIAPADGDSPGSSQGDVYSTCDAEYADCGEVAATVGGRAVTEQGTMGRTPKKGLTLKGIFSR